MSKYPHRSHLDTSATMFKGQRLASCSRENIAVLHLDKVSQILEMPKLPKDVHMDISISKVTQATRDVITRTSRP
jgi:hypothetical protein